MASKTFKGTAVSTGVAIALGSAPPTLAQEEEIEEVVVTGSYIRRTEYDGRAPIQIVDQETFEMIGAVQPIEMVKELTVNSGSAYYNETNDAQGISQFNIRNLGLGSTLTLINGKRGGLSAVGDATGTDFLDINQFPLAMIERIEVLTNGASATYGSQAVAGVANIITRKGFEGLEISGGYSTAEIDAWHLNLAAGAGHDKGHFNIYATYYEQDRSGRSEFDWLDDRLNGNGIGGRSRFLSGTGSPGSSERAFIDPVTGEATSVDGAIRVPDPDCEAAGGVIGDPADTGLNPNTCRYNFADQVSVIASEQRTQVFTEADWEFSDKVRGYMEASFSNNRVISSTGGQLLATGKATNGGTTILPSHPFNFFVEDPANGEELIYIGPENWDPAIHCTDASVAGCQFQTATLRNIHRPLGPDVTDVRPQPENFVDINYSRVLTGIEWELPGDWYLDTSFMWARSQFVDATAAGIRSDTYQQMLREGSWNPFGTRITNPGLVSPKDLADTANCFNAEFGGCVAGNSEDNRRRWNQYGGENTSMQEKVVDVVAAGELFEIGNVPLAGAIGAQYREVSYASYPDSLSSAGEDGGQGIAGAVIGSQHATAIFAEVVAPIGDFGEVQFAVRNEDYGDVSTTDPKVSAEFGITENIAVRGSWGTSFQAPAIRQTGRSTSSAFIDDPASATGPGGSFICNDQQVSNNIATAVEGAPDLKPQEAENLNLGLVFTWQNLRASIDYFLFDYTGLIAGEEAVQAIVSAQCPNNDSSPIIEDPRVVRDATGQVRSVTTQFVNIGAVETSGIDVNLDYSLDLNNSSLMFSAAGTFLDKFEVDTNGDGVLNFDGAGNRNQTNNFNTMPEVRAVASVTWFVGDHAARLGLNHIGSYDNDQGGFAEVNSWTTLDVLYSYTFSGLIGDGDTTLTVGANNLLDEDPPALYRCEDGFSDPVAQSCSQRGGRFTSSGLYNRGWVDRPGYDDRAGHDLRGVIAYVRFKHLF